MDVSVVIPSYNQREFLGEAIESVLNQTETPHQIIVTDDGSTDGTQDVIQRYADAYPDLVIPVLHEENRGIPQNFNAGLERVTGDFITFLAGDDRFRPRKLERESALLEEPDIGIAFSNFVKVDKGGKELDVWTTNQPPEGNVFRECFTRSWPKNSLFRLPMCRMDVLEEIGFYDESLPLFEDWDIKIQLSKQTQAAYCPEVLSEYRQHDDAISNQSNWNLRAQAFRDIYQKNRKLLSDLPEDEQVEIERELETLLLRYVALALNCEGRRLPALQRYCSYLLQRPSEVKNYKLHQTFAADLIRF